MAIVAAAGLAVLCCVATGLLAGGASTAIASVASRSWLLAGVGALLVAIAITAHWRIRRRRPPGC
jgi:hypothetical protein